MAIATNIFDQLRLNQLESADVNFETPSNNGLYMALVTSGYTPNQNTHDFWNDASGSEVSGNNYTAGGNALANPTVTMDGAGLVTVDADDPATWSEDASGFSNARRAVIYHDTGVDSTSRLILYSNDFGADQGNVGADLTIALGASLFTQAR